MKHNLMGTYALQFTLAILCAALNERQMWKAALKHAVCEEKSDRYTDNVCG